MTQQNPYGQPQQGVPQPVQTKGKKKGGCMKWALIIIGAIFALGILSMMFSGGDDSVENEAPKETTTKEDKKEAPKEEKAPAETPPEEEAPQEEKPAEEAPKQDVSREQRNALKSAENYLSFSGFSEQGLREQLEFEEFPADAIDYALNNVEVDWNEEALQSAQNYDEIGGMSDEGLRGQLEYEGFSAEQIEYALSNL